MTDEIRNALLAAQAALERVEWGADIDIWSPTCRWCGGYQRSPAMDQGDGPAGHKDDCPRQTALARIAEALKESSR